jgi:Taurine catabolism dioxygenase TauD, TfdA family
MLDLGMGREFLSGREAHEIRQAIHRNTILDRCQKGDLLMIDNFSTSHGRQPTHNSGSRR